MKNIVGRNIGVKEIQKSKMHYRMIISGMEIPPPVRYISRYNVECVEKAVEYILSPEQIKTLSWGTNTFIIDGEEIIFPHFTHKKIKENIYRDYIERFDDNKRVSYRSFMKVINTLTSFDR